MILVDSSVWIEHIRSPDEVMLVLLRERRVLTHPFVIGEVALGHVRRRATVLAELKELRLAKVAEEEEVLRLIENHRLYGLGIGYIDAHLLASCLLTRTDALWTLDRKFHAAALKLGIAADRQ
jgi:predicted nucleic acid-binding protein